jgi:hypothetical protein
VQAARAALVRQLRKQQADVHVLDLPVGDGVNGPDDYIGILGDGAMEQLFDGVAEGARVLDDVAGFIRRFVSLSPEQAFVVALWVLHTHAFDAADSTPYLAITSAEKRSGKTRLLEILELVVARPWLTGRVSAAALVRKIDAEAPTLLLDESDAAFAGDKEYSEALRGILNSGHRRGGKTSLCVGQGSNITFKDFSVFAPKAVAGIGKLPDTIADRSIPIRLERKKPGEGVARFRHRLWGRKLASFAPELRHGQAAN